MGDSFIKRRFEQNISNLIDNDFYRGIRHKFFLPTRGQRTRSNANTQRSKRYLNLKNV